MYEDHWRWQNTNPLVVPEMVCPGANCSAAGPPFSETHDLGGFAFAYFSDPDGN
jgi:hypothetical protein